MSQKYGMPKVRQKITHNLKKTAVYSKTLIEHILGTFISLDIYYNITETPPQIY